MSSYNYPRDQSVGHSLNDSALCSLVQTIKGGDVLARELKVVNVGIALDSAWRVTLWQRDLECGVSLWSRRFEKDSRASTYPALLQTVSNQDLAGALVVLLGNGFQSLVLGLLVTDKRAVRLDDNLVILTELDCFTLLVPRVKLCCQVSMWHVFITRAEN